VYDADAHAKLVTGRGASIEVALETAVALGL
jgi:hypothetical protein